DGKATVTFTAPADGGSAITGYTVTAQQGGGTWPCASSPCTVGGLLNGTSYSFSVTATNAIGTSPASASSEVVTPAGAPDTPTGLTGKAATTSVTLTFAEPGSGGSAILGYQVSTDGGTTWTPLNAEGTVGGLQPATAYDISVRAVNAVGAGPAT